MKLNFIIGFLCLSGIVSAQSLFPKDSLKADFRIPIRHLEEKFFTLLIPYLMTIMSGIPLIKKQNYAIFWMKFWSEILPEGFICFQL